MNLMKKITKVSTIASVGLALTFALVGCSSSATQEDSYVPPGVELGDKVVPPPAELPPPLEQEAVSPPAE